MSAAPLGVLDGAEHASPLLAATPIGSKHNPQKQRSRLG